jgi:regulator of cell morphogenesis and NO signaling
MTMNITIGEIVADDFRAASVFREAGIDFCCGGKKTIGYACQEKGIDEGLIRQKLADLRDSPSATVHNYKEWEPSFLCDYIVNTHHKYVQKSLPELEFYTSKISSVHGDRHPELRTIESLFAEVSRELAQHLRNEEEIFFPAVKELFSKGSDTSKEILTDKIASLSGEHEFAGGAIDRIYALSSGYSVPEDGCNTYRVTYQLLKEFEEDLHIHVHLENNVLFPAILKEINKQII